MVLLLLLLVVFLFWHVVVLVQVSMMRLSVEVIILIIVWMSGCMPFELKPFKWSMLYIVMAMLVMCLKWLMLCVRAFILGVPEVLLISFIKIRIEVAKIAMILLIVSIMAPLAMVNRLVAVTQIQEVMVKRVPVIIEIHISPTIVVGI